MSQLVFRQIVENIDKLLACTQITDLAGNTLASWEAQGFVGWDGGMDSYSIRLENGDDVIWEVFEGVRTFGKLCELINAQFDMPSGVFKFVNAFPKDHKNS